MPRGRRKKSDDDAFETPQGPSGSIVDGDEGVKGGADKDDGLMSVKEFVGADGSEDHWRDVHWVYNNLWVKEVEAKDAPSAGLGSGLWIAGGAGRRGRSSGTTT